MLDVFGLFFHGHSVSLFPPGLGAPGNGEVSRLRSAPLMRKLGTLGSPHRVPPRTLRLSGGQPWALARDSAKIDACHGGTGRIAKAHRMHSSIRDGELPLPDIHSVRMAALFFRWRRPSGVFVSLISRASPPDRAIFSWRPSRLRPSAPPGRGRYYRVGVVRRAAVDGRIDIAISPRMVLNSQGGALRRLATRTSRRVAWQSSRNARLAAVSSAPISCDAKLDLRDSERRAVPLSPDHSCVGLCH